jgi:hypothetical protein
MNPAIKKLLISTLTIIGGTYAMIVEILPLNLYISLSSLILHIIMVIALIVWIGSLVEIITLSTRNSIKKEKSKRISNLFKNRSF